MPNDQVRKYQKALVDPTHESVRGVRVPRMLPAELATYALHERQELGSGSWLVLHNKELIARDDFIVFRNAVLVN